MPMIKSISRNVVELNLHLSAVISFQWMDAKGIWRCSATTVGSLSHLGQNIFKRFNTTKNLRRRVQAYRVDNLCCRPTHYAVHFFLLDIRSIYTIRREQFFHHSFSLTPPHRPSTVRHFCPPLYDSAGSQELTKLFTRRTTQFTLTLT